MENKKLKNNMEEYLKIYKDCQTLEKELQKFISKVERKKLKNCKK
jgi:translation initiation factor 2 beta subunit (eIF-2beta)/eIF-5